jgi:uncharacterized alkaline shock family protein YloU
MRNQGKISLGTVQVHKRVIADICAAAVGGIEGVTMAHNDRLEGFMDLFGARVNSSVDVTVDAAGQVSVIIKVLVRYGLNLSDVARRVQDDVMTAVEKMADINLKDVDVSIQGIERGQA